MTTTKVHHWIHTRWGHIRGQVISQTAVWTTVLLTENIVYGIRGDVLDAAGDTHVFRTGFARLDGMIETDRYGFTTQDLHDLAKERNVSPDDFAALVEHCGGRQSVFMIEAMIRAGEVA